MIASNPTHSFPQGPKVALQFLKGSDGNICLQLLSSEEFTASFFIEFPEALRGKLLGWLLAYSKKELLPPLHLPRQILPAFSERVLDKLLEIPLGKTLSYGEIALKAGNQKASRAVGTICRLNTWPLFIPCHRVLPKTGEIGGYAFGSSIKKALLQFEGAL